MQLETQIVTTLCHFSDSHQNSDDNNFYIFLPLKYSIIKNEKKYLLCQNSLGWRGKLPGQWLK